MGLLDTGFVRLAAQDPRLPLALLSRVMRAILLAQSLDAERDGRLVGAIVPKVFVLPDKRRCGATFWLMTAPEARGSGVGGRLVEATLEYFEEHGCREAFACVEGYTVTRA